MANTLLGQTQYTYGTLQNTTQTLSNTYPPAQWTTGGTVSQPYYYWTTPMPSEAEKAGKAIAILKELRADGLIQIDSVERFCEMIDKIASKI